MSPEAQRIAIAEARGYKVKWVETPDDHLVSSHYLATLGGYVSALPDYLNDLNAMHEAVMSLSLTLRTANTSVLFDVCGNWAEAVNATAAQRAEAFLRTVGKWDDSK